MERNLIAEKSFEFAVNIVRLCQQIQKSHNEFVISRQLLKSGTSIGANIEEALGGYSKKDFAAKMSISYKETRETKYWLKLLNSTNFVENEEFKVLYNQADELGRILYKIIQNVRSQDN